MAATLGGDDSTSTKARALAALAQLPDDATFDEIMERLRLVHEVHLGIEDANAGRVLDRQQMESRLQRWLT